MKYNFGQWRRKFRLVHLSLLVMLGAAAVSQAEAGGVDFKQASNKNPAVGNVVWINSILQQNNSRYFEGLSTLQRLVLLDIPPATGDNPNRHALAFSHQAAKSGLHAYDFLTSWEQARAASLYYSGSDLFDPLNPDGENLTGASTGKIIRQLRSGPYRFAATAPNTMGVIENDDVQARANAYAVKFGERVIRLYGDAPIASAELRFNGYSGNTDKFAEYTLVWESSSTNLLVEMAGHLAVSGLSGNPLGYGPGRGSASINGGPYHFKLATLDGASLGSQDNQIKGADIMVPPPVVALNLTAQNICVGSAPATFTATVTADGTAPFSYAWTGPNGFTSNAPTISVQVAGTYTVVVTDGNGLTSPALSALLTVTPCPTVTIASAEITCAKPQVELVAESSATNLSYHWSGPGIVAGGAQRILTVNQPGEYSLIAADPNGCSTTAKVAVAENKIQPNASATGGTLTCANPQITVRALSATTGGVFQWSGPGIVAGADTAAPTVNVPGTYRVTVTDPLNGCFATATAIVNENKTAPLVAASGGALTCVQKELRLAASSSAAGTTFIWTGPGVVSGADTASPLINKPGEYRVTAQDPVNGCSSSAIATVTENISAPVVSVTGATLTCAKPEMSLHAACVTAGATFRWSGPGILSGTETVSPLVNLTGVYSVTVTDPANGCATTASVTVTEDKQPPVVSATGGTLTCAEPTATLRAVSSSATSTFVWTGPGIVSGAATATPSVTQPGTYSVLITDERNGCSSTVTAVVNENKTAPEITVTGGTLTCSNPQITVRAFSATAGALFQWSGPGIVAGADTATLTVNMVGTYQVTVTDPLNGCVAIATAVVNENKTVPVVSAAGGVLTCAQKELRLSASSSAAGAKFTWSGQGIVSGADTASPLINKPGDYVVTVQDPVNGCSSTTVATVTENLSAPVVNVTGATLTCAKTEMSLHAACATAGATFRWSGPGIVSGAETDSPLVNLAGIYSVTVTDPANGCATTASVTVAEDKLPPVVSATGGTLTCAEPNATLRAVSSSASSSFVWTGPGIVSGAATATPSVNQPGTYSVVITDERNGCSSTVTAVVNENKTAPEITATGGTLTCANPQITVRAFSSTAGALFQWSGPGIVAGGDTSQVTVNAAGTYVVTATDPANGCSATATAVVLENKTVPSVTAEGGVLTCAQQTLNLRAGSAVANGVFMWTGPGILAGADSASPTVNAPGAYTVVVTDPANGCTGSATVTVTQDTSAPEVTAQGAVMTSTQTQAVISATVTKPGMTCLWSGPGIVSGEHTGECVVNAPGLYSIAMTDPVTGCSTTKSVSVTQDAPLPVTLARPTSNGQIGVNYYSSLVAGGGVPPYTVSIIGDSLPVGLTLTPSTGALTGVPTEPGNFGFTAQVVDSRASSITINCQITIIGNGGYRVTGGSNRGTNMFQAGCITTALPTFVSHGGQVGAAYSVATPFNPNSECISGEWQHSRHLRGNSLVGKLHASGNGNVHQFDSLLGACLPCPEDLGAVGVVGGVCNPGSRSCGPEPRRAPANKICFSGVGDYTFSTGNKTVKAVFRVDIEDRGEGGSQGSSQLSDRYRIRIWLLDASCGRNPDPDSPEAMELRYAASADPDKIAALATTEDLKVNIPPDIDDGGNMTQGNHQIHPETGAQCGESAHNPPLLKTVRGAGGTIVATWPAVHSNYVLQTSTSLTSTNWANVTITPVIAKNRRMVTNQIGNGIQLFRLKKR